MFRLSNKKRRKDDVNERPKIGADLNFPSREAYRTLRTNLSFSFIGEDKRRIIGITSACPQDGKSLTSINLAYALAEAGNRVILIDADMRRPSISKKLGLRHAPGLSNYLTGEETRVAHSAILDENLSVITSGDIPPNPSELLGSEKMKETLDLFAEHFDYVIVDLPPVNSVSDSLAVSSFVSGMIVVLKHGYTRRGDVDEAIRQLKFANARIFGFVYNGYVPEKGSYRGRSYRHIYNENEYTSEAELDEIPVGKG